MVGADVDDVFTTQCLSVAMQYSAAQEVAKALGLSVATDPHEGHPIDGLRGACRWVSRALVLFEG